MLKLKTSMLAAALTLALTTLAAATPAPHSTGTAGLNPIMKPTPASIAAARAAADARISPVPVAVDLPVLSVQQIVDRNTTARGGLQAWQRVGSMSLIGRLDAGKTRTDGGQVAVVSKQERAKAKAEMRKALQVGKPLAQAPKVIQLPFQMDLKRPSMTRLEIPFQGEMAVQVYDGANGWKLRPYLGRHEVEPFSQDELKSAASQQELDGPLFNYPAKGTSVALEGGELVDGRSAYKLKLVLKNGDERHLWIDAQTFLDVKIDSVPRRMDGKLRTVVTYFRDYKPVEGLLVAHRLETGVEGLAGTQNIFIEKVALNPMLGESHFSKPQ
ncbi:MAG: outer membrane lipoprotein-sorting protein [Rhodoferax sp.]|uniref:outer membrane lipoprotein-sorting protein n=1 Tax=Rhodoferax sp. TaxID=50421 RepID=UPI003017536E